MASVSSVSAAIASLAAAVLARRLVLADPVPIITPSTIGIERQSDHLPFILFSLTFAGRGPHSLVFPTALLIEPAQGRGLLLSLQIYEGRN
jgi:hypothetical protein